MQQESPKISPEEAKKVLEEEKSQRTLECSKELTDILKKYNCDLTFAINVTAKD